MQKGKKKKKIAEKKLGNEESKRNRKEDKHNER